MKYKIYISTNTTQPINCFEDEELNESVETLVSGLDQESPVKMITESVFLIWDNLKSLENITKEISYLLYHEKTKASFSNIENLFVLSLQGHHLQGEKYHYATAFKIILDNSISQEDKARHIFDELFGQKMLDKIKLIKANFLNHIYNGNKPLDFVIPEIVLNTNGISEFVNYFKDYPYNNEDKDLCSEQNIKFLQLRTLLDFK